MISHQRIPAYMFMPTYSVCTCIHGKDIILLSIRLCATQKGMNVVNVTCFYNAENSTYTCILTRELGRSDITRGQERDNQRERKSERERKLVAVLQFL